MYESFFSLKVKPFDLLPNPDFLFQSRSHKKVMTYLDFSVRDRAGFILLSGEIGSGKTTVIRDLFKKHHDDIVFSRIFNTRVNFEQLLAMINDDFGLPVENRDKLTLLRDLNDFLIMQYAKGCRSILIIDEAQNLPSETLEEIRLLSNLETDNVKLLHIVLVGQPEIRQMLSMPELLQLRQRVGCFCHIQPLDQDEIEPYILHRLECAGNRNAVTFSPESLELIWRCSRGIPRLINIICNFMLLLAFAEGVHELTPELAQAVVADLDFENCYWRSSALPVAGLERSVPETCNEVAVKEPQDNITKEMLTEILSHIDQLEKKGRRPGTKAGADIIAHLERMEQLLNVFFSSTSLRLDEIQKELRYLRAAPDKNSPSLKEEGGRKKGLFASLFRTA